MIKNLLASALMLGVFSINCLGQNPVKISTIKTIPLSHGKVSSGLNIPNSPNTSNVNFNGERCGSGIIHNYLMANDPVYKANHEQEQKNIP